MTLLQLFIDFSIANLAGAIAAYRWGFLSPLTLVVYASALMLGTWGVM